jgi:hypothetical protein
MSQWDGMPETPPPASMLGKQGRKAMEKVRDAVVAAQKPPTEDQLRVITDARQAMVVEIINDPEFDPGQRVAELEGELLEHVAAVERLVVELGAQKGALRWTQNILMGYRPVPFMANGPATQRLRRGDGGSAVELIAALREALGMAEVAPLADRWGRVAA